jgi:hypothetical protein
MSLTRDCAGPDARDPGCSAIAGAAAQSCSWSPPPPLPSRKPQPNLAHHHSDMFNGKKASRPRDRISAIPTVAPFVVGPARGVGGAERSSAALILRHDQLERCLLGRATPSLLLDHLPLHSFSPTPSSLGRSSLVMHRQPLSSRPAQYSPSSASPQLKS